MNAHNSPNETGDLADLAELERRLSIITDANRSEEDIVDLSDSDFLQVQTFDRLVKLANQSISLKPVTWGHTAAPKKSFNNKFGNFLWRLTGTAAVIALMATAVTLYQFGALNSQSSLQTSASSEVSDASVSYWDNTFEDQLAEFEGEMVCLNNDYSYSDAYIYSTMFYDAGDF